MVKGSKSDKETTYDFRDIVLAKVRGYPPWPGMVRSSFIALQPIHLLAISLDHVQVVDPQNVEKDVLKERPQNKKSSFYCVKFFPKGDQ